jgi:hypothetical protein
MKSWYFPTRRFKVLALSTEAVHTIPTRRVLKIVIYDADTLCAFYWLIDRSSKYNLKQSEWLTSPVGTEWSVVTKQAANSTFIILVYLLAIYLRTLSEAQALKQGFPNFSGKGPQPLLWAGTRASCIKFTIRVMPNCVNYCVIRIVYKIYECGHERHNRNWRVGGSICLPLM